jgi:hypothetical protein
MDAKTAAPSFPAARHLQLDSPMVRHVSCVREDHHHLDLGSTNCYYAKDNYVVHRRPNPCANGDHALGCSPHQVVSVLLIED